MQIPQGGPWEWWWEMPLDIHPLVPRTLGILPIGIHYPYPSGFTYQRVPSLCHFRPSQCWIKLVTSRWCSTQQDHWIPWSRAHCCAHFDIKWSPWFAACIRIQSEKQSHCEWHSDLGILFFAMLCGIWDHSSPPMDQTHTPSIGSGVLTAGLPGKSLKSFIKIHNHLFP